MFAANFLSTITYMRRGGRRCWRCLFACVMVSVYQGHSVSASLSLRSSIFYLEKLSEIGSNFLKIHCKICF